MSELDEKLESLIVRQLDGELSADEELALQRELMKNPGARMLADEYARVDALAGAALRETLVPSRSSLRQPTVAVEWPRQHHWSRGWLFIPGAIAAALLAMVVPFPGAQPVRNEPVPAATSPSQLHAGRPQGSIPRMGAASSDGVMRNVSDSPWLAPRVRRNTGREVIGVQGDNGNLYWLEISRTRTVRQPERAAAALPVTESL